MFYSYSYYGDSEKRVTDNAALARPTGIKVRSNKLCVIFGYIAHRTTFKNNEHCVSVH